MLKEFSVVLSFFSGWTEFSPRLVLIHGFLQDHNQLGVGVREYISPHRILGGGREIYFPSTYSCWGFNSPKRAGCAPPAPFDMRGEGAVGGWSNHNAETPKGEGALPSNSTYHNPRPSLRFVVILQISSISRTIFKNSKSYMNFTHIFMD